MAVFESFDGTAISYSDQGAGPLVVLLHGSIVDAALNWVAPGLTDRLAGGGYRVVATDARGHGASDKPRLPAAYSNGALVRDVMALLDHLSASKVALVGYSMGADTAVRVAAQDVRIAAVVAGGVGGDLGDPAEYDPVAVAASLRAGASEANKGGHDLGAALAELAGSLGGDTAALAALFEGLGCQPAPDLESVSCPTLVIAGDRDTMSGGDPADLALRLPRAELVTLPGLDHFGAVFDASFADAVMDFLQRHYPPRRDR